MFHLHSCPHKSPCSVLLFTHKVGFNCTFLHWFSGRDVGGGGVHFLLLPNGRDELPPAAGAPGVVRFGRGAAEPGSGEEVEAGGVWEHGRQLLGLLPQSVLCGRHAARLSGRALNSPGRCPILLPAVCVFVRRQLPAPAAHRFRGATRVAGHQGHVVNCIWMAKYILTHARVLKAS